MELQRLIGPLLVCFFIGLVSVWTSPVIPEEGGIDMGNIPILPIEEECPTNESMTDKRCLHSLTVDVIAEQNPMLPDKKSCVCLPSLVCWEIKVGEKYKCITFEQMLQEEKKREVFNANMVEPPEA